MSNQITTNAGPTAAVPATMDVEIEAVTPTWRPTVANAAEAMKAEG